MPDYQILKITINSESPDANVYFRREVVGSRTLGGDLVPPYPKERIVRVHAAISKRSGSRATLFDRAAAKAETIDVEILHQNELCNSAARDADMIVRILIGKFKDENVEWRKSLLNMKFSPER